jgi:hypothetical protein
MRRLVVRFPFWWSFRRSAQRVEPSPTGPDPIDHPAIAAMSLRELADLPMWRMPAREEAVANLPPRAKQERCGAGELQHWRLTRPR